MNALTDVQLNKVISENFLAIYELKKVLLHVAPLSTRTIKLSALSNRLLLSEHISLTDCNFSTNIIVTLDSVVPIRKYDVVIRNVILL